MFCPFSLGARVRARLPKVLFSLTRVCTAFCIFIVSFKETASLGSLIQPALQFLNVETRFPMLTETCTLEYSFVFCLESLWRKTWLSCVGVLWMGLESCDRLVLFRIALRVAVR